jgi:mono/diheme cytochrome c family protein
MSPSLVRQRMEQMGRPINAVFARTLAAASRQDLRKRLATGGERMPAFGHLNDDEVDALVAYLEWLAGVPGAAERQRVVKKPALRVGEHLVKGTCHICHDATGPWPDPEALLDGAIPSLSGISSQRTIHDVLTKVRYGKPVVMGRVQMAYRGRMPVFDHISDAEVVAAYAYLGAFPPESASRQPAPLAVVRTN